MVAPSPAWCRPFAHHQGGWNRIDEYGRMVENQEYPAIRAWIKEADRTCRANNRLIPDVD